MLTSSALAVLLGGLIGLSNRVGVLFIAMAALLIGGKYLYISWIDLIVLLTIAQISYLAFSFLGYYTGMARQTTSESKTRSYRS